MAKKRMKPKADLYAEVGVPRDADDKAIRRAYRRRAKQVHPDAGGTAEAFERLQFAHLVLTDQRRRAEYDRTGECEEPGPDTAEQEAMGVIGAVVALVVRGNFDAFTCDLRAKMMADIGVSLGQYQAELADTVRMRKRAERLIGRFIKKTPGSPLIDIMLRNFAEKFGSLEPRQTDIVKAHKRALEILKDYDFKADPKPPGQTNQRPNPFFGGISTYGGFGT